MPETGRSGPNRARLNGYWPAWLVLAGMLVVTAAAHRVVGDQIRDREEARVDLLARDIQHRIGVALRSRVAVLEAARGLILSLIHISEPTRPY